MAAPADLAERLTDILDRIAHGAPGGGPSQGRASILALLAEARAEERKAHRKWLNQTMIEISEKPAKPDKAILCGGKATSEDYMQVGFMTCFLHWKAAIRARSDHQPEAEADE